MAVSEHVLFHGSRFIVDHPHADTEGIHKDLGPGFYCTESEDGAKEWACTFESDGFANRFELDTRGLRILDLSSRKYHILNYLAELLANRRPCLVGESLQEICAFIVDRYRIDPEKYDIICGWRADNSCFSFAMHFLNSDISLDEFRLLLRQADKVKQWNIRSEKALEKLVYTGGIPADRLLYYPAMLARDSASRKLYAKLKDNGTGEQYYMTDIFRGEWDNDDPRLRGRLS